MSVDRNAWRQVDAVLHVDLTDGVLQLPADLQKDYPNERTPSYTEIELAGESVPRLRMYSVAAGRRRRRSGRHASPTG